MNTRIWSHAPVTMVLLTIQIVVFVMMTFLGGSTNEAVLILFGARQTQLIDAGQWWRLITPVFVHIGFTHLLVNSLTLYFMGLYIEEIFGHWRMLIIYLLSAFVGNLASAVFLPNTISAGASTALFGLFGAFLMLGESYRNNYAVHQLSRQFLILVILNIGIDLFMPGIDLAGHLGGLFGGFLTAYVVGAPLMGPINRRKQAICLVVLIAGILIISSKMSW